MKLRVFLIIAILFFFLFLESAYGQGCSQCKLIAEQSSEAGEASFATNINKGILLLMAMPYLILLIALRKKIIGLFQKKSIG